jgi:phosphatidate cytidylyltransferase
VIASPHRVARGGGNVPSGKGDASNLMLRIASAAVLAPIVLASAYVGGWLFLILCAIAAAAILWEWTHLVAGRSDPQILAPGLAALLTALAFAGMNEAGAAAGVIAIGAVLAGVVALARPVGYAAASPGVWAAGGVFYAGVAFLGPALLRRDSELGFVAILFLAGTVWLTDIFAYSVGRTLGGPLLWPRVSPNKTWAGAVGGLAGGVAGGTLVAYASGIGRLAVVAVIALVLSVLAQAGDLFESAVKRRFGAKDASRLIPGHGGLMDRLDGFLVAALAALLVGILRQGTDAPAQGLLLW